MCDNKNMGKLRQYINDYLEHLEIEKGRAVKTIDNYRRYLERFARLSKAAAPKDITENTVRAFRLFLNREGVSKKTQNYYLIALRGFLSYLAKHNIESLPAQLIELARIAEKELDLITPDELNRLLLAADGKSLRALRDSAILELLFSTGMRVSELCGLDRDKINIRQDEISIKGKGGKIRVVFVSEKAKNAVKKYLNERTDIDPALFVRTRNIKTGGPLRLTPRSVQRIIKYYAGRAGVAKKLTPHVLRHMFATDLLSAGADIRSVQTLLGHASISTTQVYSKLANDQLRHEYDRAHPR
ncbi:tyrosine-type recombinase/integrase, partial [Candidatus Uhrbacteria bacterium]|nr:tyrosine-type recombinase/integrase [Candidatus Uhrbacteria bacterium]